MTKQEYDNWMELTALSKDRWMLDYVTFFNKKEILVYKGGEVGKFIEIDQNGVLSIGTYEGALPHIGDSTFRTVAKKQYASFGEALAGAITAGGMKFLQDLLPKEGLK